MASQTFEELNELFEKDDLNEIYKGKPEDFNEFEKEKPEDQTLEDYIHELFQEKSAEPAFQTVHMEEPIEENTKRRLLAPLLPRDFVPPPPPKKEIKNTKVPRGMEKFDPFHSMHFERGGVTEEARSWVEILTNPRGENPIQEQHYQFLIEEYAPEGDVVEQRGKILTK